MTAFDFDPPKAKTHYKRPRPATGRIVFIFVALVMAAGIAVGGSMLLFAPQPPQPRPAPIADSASVEFKRTTRAYVLEARSLVRFIKEPGSFNLFQKKLTELDDLYSRIPDAPKGLYSTKDLIRRVRDRFHEANLHASAMVQAMTARDGADYEKHFIAFERCGEACTPDLDAAWAVVQ